MPIYNVPCALLPAISHAIHSISDSVPNRWEKVSVYLQKLTEKSPSIMMSTHIKFGASGQVVNMDVANRAHVRTFCGYMLSSPRKQACFSSVNYADGFCLELGVYPIIFVPAEMECQCGGSLTTYPRPCTVTLVTNDGIKQGTLFHKKCSVCSLKLYHSYTQDLQGTKRFRQDALSDSYFLISNRTGFELSYLRTICDLIETAAVSFTAACESYEVTHSGPLERQRLEEAYFLCRLIQLFATNDQILSVEQRDNSCRIDLEALCKEGLEQLMDEQSKYAQHVCQVKGCQEGTVIADGVEKIHRRTCAAPKSTIQLLKGMPKSVTSCPETPVANSTFCADHIYLDDEDRRKRGRIVVTINTLDMKVSTQVLPMTDGLPDNADTTVHVGCKKATNVDRFTERSAGIMALVRPCGIIVDISEMLTCESPTQLFVQLLRLKCDTAANLSYLGYDRGCEFEPFLRNLKKRGNEGAEILLDSITFFVDRFHIRGHVRPECTLADPACRFHPDHSNLSDIREVNTEAAEQCFAWLRKYKNIVKYMSQYKYKFFLQRIVLSRNQYTEAKLKRRQ